MSDLRPHLHRVAESTPELHLPDDLWARGRRARRQGRMTAGAVALSLVTALGGVAALVTTGPAGPQPAAPGGEGAVPTRVWAVPERFIDDDEWRPEVAETDVAVGRASIAFGVGYDGLPAVVTARDGAYHPLVLPGQGSSMTSMEEGTGLALSPDGTRLAWSAARPASGREDYTPVPSSIRIVDLTTGRVREIDLSGLVEAAQAVVTGRLVWSPDSRWLAWSGRAYQQFNGSGTASRGPGVAGVIAPGSTRSTPLPVGFAEHPLAVTDDGEVLGRRGGQYAVWRRGQVTGLGRELVRGSQMDGVGATSPDGRHVALPRNLPGTRVSVLDIATGRIRTSRVPEGVGRVVAQPLGWVDEDRMVLQVAQTAGETGAGWTSSAPQIVVMAAPGADPGTEPYRVVSRWEAGDDVSTTPRFSVAVDLIRPGDLSRDFPQPDWPWSVERKITVVGSAILGLALAAYLLVLVRRRRRTASYRTVAGSNRP